MLLSTYVEIDITRHIVYFKIKVDFEIPSR